MAEGASYEVESRPMRREALALAALACSLLVARTTVAQPTPAPARPPVQAEPAPAATGPYSGMAGYGILGLRGARLDVSGTDADAVSYALQVAYAFDVLVNLEHLSLRASSVGAPP